MPTSRWYKQSPDSTSVLTSPFLNRRQLFIFRLLCAALLCGMIVAGISTVHRVPYILYLTNWMAILNTLYFLVSAFSESHSFAQSSAYALNHICIPNSIMVCVLFWTAVQPYIPPGSLSHFKIFQNVVDHGITLILLLVDYSLSHITFSIFYIYWPALIIAYIPVNAYYSISYKPIYFALSYKNYTSVIFLLSALIVSLGSFVLICWITPKVKYYQSKNTMMEAIVVHKSISV